MVRGHHNKPGEYHKVIHLWIRNAQGAYLIQQRNKASDHHPYQWAPTAGAVIQGETPIQCVLRESKEEIGLTIDPDKLIHIDTIYVENYKANFIIELFLIHMDVDMDQVCIDPTEVKKVALVDNEHIHNLLKNQQFWNFDDIDPQYLQKLERSIK